MREYEAIAERAWAIFWAQRYRDVQHKHRNRMSGWAWHHTPAPARTPVQVTL